jgi:hypothetical protein
VGNVSAFAVAKVELDGTGIRVLCVQPGFVRTPMTEHLAWSADGRTWLPRFGRSAEQRWGGPQPAADLVEAIALGAADPLSGRVLHVGDDLTGCWKGATKTPTYVVSGSTLTDRQRSPVNKQPAPTLQHGRGAI